MSLPFLNYSEVNIAILVCFPSRIGFIGLGPAHAVELAAELRVPAGGVNPAAIGLALRKLADLQVTAKIHVNGGAESCSFLSGCAKSETFKPMEPNRVPEFSLKWIKVQDLGITSQPAPLPTPFLAPKGSSLR
jgi:hypothetical protein